MQSTRLRSQAGSVESESRVGRWIIAITVSLAALLEVLDTSIVNVALTKIQGNLGATLTEVGWVVTSYAIANAIIIPLTAWLGQFFGKKRYFIFSLIGFTASSVMCGMANNLPFLVVARILQGLCGGGLLAKAQAILFETFPPEEQAAAQGVFGLCVMVGPVLGPTLGGWLTDTIDWRWIFYINVPFGVAAVIMSILFLPRDRIATRGSVDWPGIAMLALSVGCLQTILEEGQQADWFSSPLIVSLTVVAVVTFVLLIWRELAARSPAIDLRILRYKSLAAGSVYSLVLGMGLYGATFAVPIFAQNIMHYTSMQTGMLMLPAAIASAITMPLFARLNGKLDSRLVIAAGSIITAFTMFAMGTMNPDTSAESLFWPLIFRGVGSVFMFMSLSLATIGPLPKRDVAQASGFFSLTRQMGGSIGVACLATLLDQRQNFHRAMLVENVHAYNPLLMERLSQFGTAVTGRVDYGVHQLSSSNAMAIVNAALNTQASILSFGDIFWVVGIMFLVSLPLVFFLGNGRHASSDLHA